MANDILNPLPLKIATVASFLLLFFGGFKYLLTPNRDIGNDPFDVDETPFSALPFLLFWFWTVLYVVQAAFIVQAFVPMAAGYLLRIQIFGLVGWHFVIFNVLHWGWLALFALRHFVLAWMVLLLNFVNILVLYISHKTFAIRPLGAWMLIHIPVTALPFSWLFFAIFWNGAVMLHVHKFVGRVVSNVLIWDFLLVPGFYLAIYNDWAIGLSLSYLMFALGVGQIFTKTFALQWIFAYIISALLFVASAVVAFTGSPEVIEEESAPLLTA